MLYPHLTPPSQNTSESDISDNFLEPDYNDTDDEFGISLERPPSRPILNYGIFLLASPRGRTEKGRDLQGVVSFVVKYLGRY